MRTPGLDDTICFTSLLYGKLFCNVVADISSLSQCFYSLCVVLTNEKPSLGFTETFIYFMGKRHRFSGIHRYPFSCLICVPRSASGSDLFQGSPFEYAEGGHGGSGTQGTL